MLRVYYLLLHLWISVDLSSGSYLVLAPKELRLGTDHDVIVITNGVPETESDFRLYLSSTHNPRFSESTLQVRNGEARKVTVRVDVTHVPDPHDSQVSLTLESTAGAMTEQTNIPVTRVSGYIFVQTDKPMYTPRQTVKYRIIALDEDQRWAPWRVQIDIINPRGIVVERKVQTPQEAFNGAEFPLLRNPMVGTWTINASYSDQVETINSVTFDVLEYVLPRFGIRLTSSPPTVYVGQNMPTLNVTVTVRYVYNQPVKGSVELDLLAVMNNVTCYFMTNLTGELDRSGRLLIQVDGMDLLEAINYKYDNCSKRDYNYDPSYDPVELEAEVRVREIGTGHVVYKRFTSALVTVRTLDIEAVDFRQFYKPEMEYQFKVKILSSGNPLAKQKVTCKVGNQTLQGTTTASGIASFVFMPPPGVFFNIEITVMDKEHSETMRQFFVKREKTELQRHISVYLTQQPKAGRPIKVTIRYSHPPRRYYLLMITRGKIVYLRNCVSSAGDRDAWTIPASFTRGLSPLSRIVVLYIAREGSLTEVVADAVVIRTGNKCIEELRLSVPKRPAEKSLSDQHTLGISGGPGMRVGLLAVDKAVYSVRFEKSLTRKLIFQEFEDHDLGQTGGPGIDALETLRNAGFTIMTNANIAFKGTVYLSDRSRPHDPMGQRSANNKRLRSYFPESWLFQETTLSETGKGSVNFVYPDSMTTWVLQGVGVSAARGLCVSPSVKVVVAKRFFVDLYIPYKVTRLETIVPKISVVNYNNFNLEVSVHISGDQGLCFPKGEDGSIHYDHVIIPANDMVVKTFTVIPVMVGELAIEVRVEDVMKFDGVRKILHVVAEGEEMEKTITFNLDPQGRARQAMMGESLTQKNLTFSEDATVTHIYTDRLEQYTDVDLALPVETIPGSESVQVFASGDLLGDVIHYSDSDDDDAITGEEIMTTLSPLVMGLNHLIISGDVDHDTVQRGRRHIRNGIVNLLKLRDDSGGFRFFDPFPPSTWFTAFVLRTLCEAKRITFVSQRVINKGFKWLHSRVNKRIKTPIDEDDPMPYQMSAADSNVMLGAEILTAVNQCAFKISRSLKSRRIALKRLLKNGHRRLKNPLARAKVAFAMYQAGIYLWKQATRKLFMTKKTTSDGLFYWSELSEQEIKEKTYYERSIPIADAIETTSYALILSLKLKVKRGRRKGQHVLDPDRIACWIIKWRNKHGIFISAMDTAVATMALAKYREYKNIKNTNLYLDISNTEHNFNQSLQFDNQSALSIKAVPEVPPVPFLHVNTRGEGLGQMHVHAKYNLHVDEEAHCQFNMTVKCYRARGGSDLCSACGIGCERKQPGCKERDTSGRTSSLIQYCLEVAIRYNGSHKHGLTKIEVNMLSGYEPHACDLEQMKGSHVTFRVFKSKVTITLSEVSNTEVHHLRFRINKEHDVRGLHPASVVIRDPIRKAHLCTRQYDTGQEVTLSVLCANSEPGQYSGDCDCVSGLCTACRPNVNLETIKHAVKKAKYIFRVEGQNIKNQQDTRLMMSTVQEVKKQCSKDDVSSGGAVRLLTMRTCRCPKFQPGQTFWVMGTQTFVRRKKDGSNTYHYWMDEKSFVVTPDHPDFNRTDFKINRTVTHIDSDTKRCV